MEGQEAGAGEMSGTERLLGLADVWENMDEPTTALTAADNLSTCAEFFMLCTSGEGRQAALRKALKDYKRLRLSE